MQVVLVSPVPSLRIGIRGMLANFPLVNIIAEIGALAAASAPLSECDLLIIARTGPPPGEVQAELEREYPTGPVLLIFEPGRLPGLAALLITRPVGLLALDASETHIQTAIQALAGGLNVISPAFSPFLTAPPGQEALIQPGSSDSQPDSPVDPLTPREKEILQALGYGLANKEIALQFKLSDHTVKYHLTSIFSKLGASNRTEAVRTGVKYGIITL